MASADDRRRSIDELDHRVRKLEGIVWVVGVLGVAFGLGGAGLLSKLSQMREAAAQIEKHVAESQTNVQQLAARAGQLETQVKGLTELTGNVDKRVAEILNVAEDKARTDLLDYVQAQRKSLLQGVIKDGDKIALRFAETRVHIGAAGGHGVVNTGAPGVAERYVVGSDETFVVERP